MISGIKFIVLATKLLGDWTNDGNCAASGPDPTCGPGIQAQIRTCTDGTVDKCTKTDRQRTVDCGAAGTLLPNCKVGAKSLGQWTNDGKCAATGADPKCGPGNQIQTRTCTDGTIDKCTDADRKRTVSCNVAGTQLPICTGNLNEIHI